MGMFTAEGVDGKCPNCGNHISDFTDDDTVECNNCGEHWFFARSYRFFSTYRERENFYNTKDASDKKLKSRRTQTPRFKD